MNCENLCSFAEVITEKQSGWTVFFEIRCIDKFNTRKLVIIFILVTCHARNVKVSICVNKIMMFAVLKAVLLQQRESDASFIFLNIFLQF